MSSHVSSHVRSRNRWWLYLLSGLVILYLVLPTLIVIPMSFSATTFLTFPPRGFSLRWYADYFSSAEWREATLVSLRVAFLTTLLATPLGVAATYALYVSSSAWARAVRGMLMAPMLVPVILFAIAAFFVLAQLRLLNSLAGLILADTVVTLPFIFITVGAGLKSYDMRQEMVARSLGASRLWAFLTVTLPQIKHAVITGMIFVFIAAFDEVVIASMLTSAGQATLTSLMFVSLQSDIDPTIAAISTLMIIVTMLPPMIMHLVQITRRTTPAEE